MKKIITILMLAIAIIAGAPTADAKTKKKAKSSSSASWNGDIPSASLIMKIGNSANVDNQLKQHGYKIIKEEHNDYSYNVTWSKSGVCKIYHYDGIEAGDTSWEIEVYDSTKCTKLYNDLKQELKSNKYWHVNKEGNKISVYYMN